MYPAQICLKKMVDFNFVIFNLTSTIKPYKIMAKENIYIVIVFL